MRIGIDAKYYYSGTPSLINVVRNLSDMLMDNNNDHELIFFLSNSDKQFESDFKERIRNKNNISYRFIPGKLNFIVNILFYPFFLRKCRLDVMIFQNYIPFLKFSNIKYINYVHDFLFLDYPHFFSRLQRYIFRFMLYSVRRADHVITISKSEMNRILVHSKIQSEKIDFVYHGISESFYERTYQEKQSIIEKYKLPEDYILYVGRLNKRKNIKSLVLAFAQIKSPHRLVIIGKEENEEFDLAQLLDKMSIKDKVYKLSYVPDNDLAHVISAATLFVFPSFAEGFGFPPLEAMRSGVPAVVSNGMALPEVCKDGVIYFNPYDINELTQSIDTMLSSDSLYVEYKSKGKKVAEEYTWNKSAKKVLLIIESLQFKYNNPN